MKAFVISLTNLFLGKEIDIEIIKLLNYKQKSIIKFFLNKITNGNLNSKKNLEFNIKNYLNKKKSYKINNSLIRKAYKTYIKCFYYFQQNSSFEKFVGSSLKIIKQNKTIISLTNMFSEIIPKISFDGFLKIFNFDSKEEFTKKKIK